MAENGNAKKYSPMEIISCIDKVSRYVESNEIYPNSFWGCTDANDFKVIYNKLNGSLSLRIPKNSVRKVFLVAGKLYLRFLNEYPVETCQDETHARHEAYAPKQPPREEAVEPVLPQFAFKKEVDWSLLNYGLTVPQVAKELFWAKPDEYLLKGSSHPIKLSVLGETYSASLTHVKSTTGSHSQLQVRYSTNSLLVRKLREIFKYTYNTMLEARNENRSIALESKEYVDVVSIAPYSYGLLCYPAKQDESQPLANEQPSLTTAPSSAPTIKEAIIHVLKDEKRSMSVKEIYNGIIARGLYSFGAKNPVDVVRRTLENACENSNAKLLAKEFFFRSKINSEGKKVYSLADKRDSSRVQEIREDIVSSLDKLNDIIDLEVGISGIREILEAHFLTLHGYSNMELVWTAAQNSLAMFLNDNAINTSKDFFGFIYRAFSSEYTINKSHIWKETPDYPQNNVGVIINLARHLGGIVTRAQIDEYFSKLRQPAPINATIIKKSELVFYESKTFIPAESINLSPERCATVKSAVDRLFADEEISHIIIRDIADEWFSLLPPISGGFRWTALLLQEILRLKPTIGYIVVFPGIDGQGLDTLGVALTMETESMTFADVVHQFCKEKGLLLELLNVLYSAL
ncbi:MAG: winged helix-turn-helix domain-containing protein [Defluviitaleaceae bacterium]|nr:winged helix-turn-helix domain-containing protein [Defluviitaleaceae bacterium]